MSNLETRITTEVKNDVKGNAERIVEEQTLNSLKEIKDKLKYDNDYLSTLYKAEFKNFLKRKSFESKNIGPDIIKLNNIKLGIIKRGLEKNKENLQKPNWVTRKIIYPACNISPDISKNSQMGNIMKGVIDELMAIPDVLLMIVKDPLAFGKGLWEMIKKPGEIRKTLKEAFTDAFTQGIATPEAQYRTGRSATLIILSLFPGGLGKSLVNVAKNTTKAAFKAGGRIVGKNTAKNTTKASFKARGKLIGGNTAKNTGEISKNAGKMTENLGKRTAKKIEKQAVKEAEKATNKTVKRIKTPEGKDRIYQKLYQKLKNKGEKTINFEKNTMKKGVEGATNVINKTPVLKQLNQFKNWNIQKLDDLTTFMFRKTNPKLYETFIKQQKNLSKFKEAINKQVLKLEKTAEKMTKVESKIAKLEKQIAEHAGNSITNIWKKELEVLKNGGVRRGKQIQGLKQMKSEFTRTERYLREANERFAVYQGIVKEVKNGKIANRNRIQQGAAFLERFQYTHIEQEITNIANQIDEELLDSIIEEIESIEDQLNGLKSEELNLASGATEVGGMTIDFPEGVDRETIERNNYTINITGLSSKTGSRDINIAIAKKRAENAKVILSNKYGIPEESFVLSEKRQGDFNEHLDEDISLWQGVKVEIKKKGGITETEESEEVEDSKDNETAEWHVPLLPPSDQNLEADEADQFLNKNIQLFDLPENDT